MEPEARITLLIFIVLGIFGYFFKRRLEREHLRKIQEGLTADAQLPFLYYWSYSHKNPYEKWKLARFLVVLGVAGGLLLFLEWLE